MENLQRPPLEMMNQEFLHNPRHFDVITYNHMEVYIISKRNYLIVIIKNIQDGELYGAKFGTNALELWRCALCFR